MNDFFMNEIAETERELTNMKMRYSLYKTVYEKIETDVVVRDLSTNILYRVIEKPSDRAFVAVDMERPHIKKAFVYLASNWCFADEELTETLKEYPVQNKRPVKTG